MSVLVPDIKVYEAVYSKAWGYAFNKTCNINYCYTLSFDDEDKLKQHVKNWLWLNEMSWIRRYEDGDKPNLEAFLTFKNGKPINTYQMFKYLQCIQYNIEIDTIEKGVKIDSDRCKLSDEMMDSYKLLEAALIEISTTIIKQIKEYKEAEWSEI